MDIKENSLIKLFPLYIHRYGDGNFRVIRRGGRSVMATRKAGLDAIEMMNRGLGLREIRDTLGRKYGDDNSTVNLKPLLNSLLKANLIKRIDGRPVCRNEVTVSSFLDFCLRFYLLPRVTRFSKRFLPLSLLRWVLYRIFFFELKRPTKQKVKNAAENMGRLLTDHSAVEIERNRKEYYSHLVKNVVDLESLMPRDPVEMDRWLEKNSRCFGLENLDLALAQKKGVLLCGFHFSSIRMIPAILIKHGYSFTTMGAINLHIGLDKMVKKADETRESLSGYGHIDFMPNLDIKGITSLIERLRRGEIVISYPDVYSIDINQDPETQERSRFFNVARAGTEFQKSKFKADFFQHSVYMTEWLGWLYSLTATTVLPVVLIRREDDKLDLVIEKPIEIDEDLVLDRSKAREAMNAKVFAALERYVAAYPAQWFGWHNLHKLGLEPKVEELFDAQKVEFITSAARAAGAGRETVIRKEVK
jgi:lauroyl/myristoyl acyltransferase